MEEKLRQGEGALFAKILVMRIDEREKVIELRILVDSLLNYHL